MKITVIDLEELEEIIRQIIREELRGTGSSIDEIGGVTLAMEITGLKSGTIYKKVQNKEIPFRQEMKGGRLRFSRNDLMEWTKANAR